MDMLLIQLLAAFVASFAPTSPAAGIPVPTQAGAGSDSFFLGARESVWTGRVQDADGKMQEVPMPATYAQDLRKELAQIQVSIDVERKLEEARSKLDDLAIRATRVGYAGRKEVLIEIALARSTLLEALGKPDDALKALTSVLVGSERPKGFKYQLSTASEADKADARAIEADARLVARREKLAGAGVASKHADSADKIEAIVKDALVRGDDSLARDLGDRAIPTLEKILLPDLDALPPQPSDALWHYVKISQPRSAEFIQQHFDEGGAIWKARIVRAMTANQVLRGNEWIYSATNEKPRLRVPQWRPVVEKLLDDPSTVLEALRYVAVLVPGDALTVRMQGSLARILRSRDKAIVDAALNALEHPAAVPTALSAYEAALSSADPDVRLAAAKHLARYPESEGLLAAAGDADPRVRQRVASAVGPHPIVTPEYRSSLGSKNSYHFPVVDDQRRKIILALSADPDADVRAALASSIILLETPLDSDVYQRLTRDEDARVRAALLHAKSIPLAERARIAAALASDEDASVLAAFDNFLFGELFDSKNPADVDPAFFPAIQTRRHNKARVFPEGGNQTWQLYASLLKTDEGLTAMAKWAVEDGEAMLANQVIRELDERVKKADKGWKRRGIRPVDVGIDPDPATLAGLFAIAHQPEKVGSEAVKITSILVALDVDLSARMIPIAKDRERSARTRVDALSVAANGNDPRLGDILLEILADPSSRAHDPTDGDGRQLRNNVKSIASALPDAVARATLRKVLADPSIGTGIALTFAEGVRQPIQGDEQMAEAILRRGLEEPTVGEKSWVVGNALQQVSTRPRAEQGDWLVRAAADPRYSTQAFELIGNLRDPSYLKVIEDFLTSPKAQTSNQAGVGPLPALNALTRYFNDEAADLILKVAGSTANASLREECFKALETIRKYQDEKGRWNDSRSSREATATAIRDLVGLLDDKDASVRAQAVRGLATLSAVQEMPRIVRMLKDTDAGVRKAAEDALGILNAPPGKD
jgi:HEAT repeat protein